MNKSKSELSRTLNLAGEKFGQSFSELVCFQPVLIRLTFQKISRQLVDLFVKPKTPAACFSKTFLVQDLYFAVRQNLALKSSSAEIQNLEKPQKKATLSVYWNPLQAEVPNFARLKGPAALHLCKVLPAHMFARPLGKGASEAPFYREGPRAFEDVFLAKNCKVIFQIGDKKLEILVFTNPQTITGRGETIRFPEEESLSCSQTRIFKTLN
jgi:hypothetical protein